MQLAPDFLAKFAAAAAAARAANGFRHFRRVLGGGGGTGPAPPDIMHDIDLMSMRWSRQERRRGLHLSTRDMRTWDAISTSFNRSR